MVGYARIALLPSLLLAALVVAAGFAAFLTWDQWHWWSVKDDYVFGYIVPLFVAYYRRALPRFLPGAGVFRRAHMNAMLKKVEVRRWS